jgi:mono/diheme cytochrome c family protein
MRHPAPASVRAARLSAAVWLVAVGAVAAVLSGCGTGGESDGRALFATNCAVCHGPAGEGTEQGPSLLDARYLPDQLSDAEMAAGIRNGVPEREFEFGPMPAFPRFEDDDLDAVVEVVRELQREAGLLEP